MKRNREEYCDRCNSIKGRKRLLRCAVCWKSKRLCAECVNLFVACSESCRERWRAAVKDGLPKEKLSGPLGAEAREPKGVARFQGDMFLKGTASR